MIPQLVVTGDKKREEKFLADLTSKYKVADHYVFRILPEKESIGIDDIRSISHIILTHIPFYRIIAIYSFETATIEAQNALLKILEEKSTQNIFVLFTTSVELVIPTVSSRVRTVLLDQKKLNEKNEGHTAVLMDEIKKGKGYAFLSNIMQKIQTKEEAVSFIDQIILFWRGKLEEENNIAPAIIRKAFQTKNQILSLNCNYQLSLDNLLIFIHKAATMN